MRETRRNLGITGLTMAIVAVSTPATLAFSIYAATGDARWRPLSQTIESTWFYSGDRPLVAEVGWPSTRDPAGGEAMATHIQRAIKARGIHAKVIVTPTDGPGHITYHIGPSHVGPMPLTRAVEGIEGAIAAYWRQSGRDEGDAI